MFGNAIADQFVGSTIDWQTGVGPRAVPALVVLLLTAATSRFLRSDRGLPPVNSQAAMVSRRPNGRRLLTVYFGLFLVFLYLPSCPADPVLVQRAGLPASSR